MQKLFLVSTGPGDPGLLAPNALQAVTASSDLVAYGLYLELLGDACNDKQQHDLPLGAEIDRAKLSLQLAASGKTTALISSGDIGIYAMATLVFELLDPQRRGEDFDPEWLNVDIEIVPGISAMQAAASRTGAILGHDFCTVSLSNLLTPWEVIENRLEHAAAGDFVVCFYNPVSKRRDWQLNHARDVLLKHRPGNTPVILGRNLTRPDETIRVITLDRLDAADVDMFTLVAVGNRETRQFTNDVKQRTWVYTPRGYANKG